MILKIIRTKEEANNCFSLILQKPKDFNFYPGQYVDVELKNDTRAFTISSSPTERFLMITTKKGVSNFKKALVKLKMGDDIKTSHPAGTFTLDESTPAVFIAGGIGITPFRSMIKYVLDQKINTPITLIYSNSDDNYLFKQELDEWQKVYPRLEIVYTNTTKSGHLTTLNTKNLTSNTIYYLAGSHSMVNEFEKILLDLGIDQINIHYDRFDGYL